MARLALSLLILALLFTTTPAALSSDLGHPRVPAVLPAGVPQPQAEEAISVIWQDCAGYGGPYPCYTSLAAWEADYGGIDFGANPPGDLVAADKVAVARIEGTWTLPDTAPLDLDGWTTDPTHYIRIYTAIEARHRGLAGTGYRLETTSGGTVWSTVAHLQIEGLEIHDHSPDGAALVYLVPNTAEGVGEIDLSHNLIHGNGVNSAHGIYNYTCGGVVRIWDNILYDLGDPGYVGAIQIGAGTAYIYNNTIADIISGFAIRADNARVVARNNLTDAPGSDFYGGFAAGTDFNACSDDTAPGLHSRRNQAFTFVDRAGKDYHLDAADAGARDYGWDLSADPYLPFADDVDGQLRAGGWDIGADEASPGTDGVAPIRFDGAPAGTLPRGTTEAVLSLSTNESAGCRCATTAGVAFADMPIAFTSTIGLTHSYTVTGLQGEQSYTYYVKCQDGAANANADDYPISFDVASSDVAPPVISDVRAVDISPYSANITWVTDEVSTSQVEYGTSAGYGSITVLSATRVTSHTVVLRGLDPATTYHFRVRSRDIGGNETVSPGATCTTAALSNLYYVNQKATNADDGNPGTLDQPWATIQHAADVAQPGDTIIVYPGDYGRVAITHGGEPGRYITFRGLNLPDQSLVDPDALFDPANPVLTPGNPDLNVVTGGFAFLRPYGDPDLIGYVRIENMEITRIYREGVPMVGRGGVYLAYTDHVEIVRNFMHDLNPNPDGYDYIGIRGDNHENYATVVKGNTLYRCQGTGISIVGRGWLVEGNELSHGLDANTDTGLEVGGDSDAVRFFGSGHVIRNNYFHDHLDEEQYGNPHIDCFQTFAVYTESQFAHDILVEGNVCRNFGQMLMIEDNDAGNYVYNITYRNNIFDGARAYAFNGGNVEHFTFVNNVVANSNYGAIGIGASPYMTVLNNIFYSNGSGSQYGDEESKVGSVWDYNIHYPDFTWPPKQGDCDQHSLFGVDPALVDPAGGDYHLTADSPAVDRGLAVTSFNYDQDYVIRPGGLGWDIGAYEFQPGFRVYLAVVYKE